MPKILAIASGGGHWVQMRRLAPAFADFDVAYASVFADYAADCGDSRFYTVNDVSRLNLLQLLRLVPQLVSILLKERPKVVITTGSAPGLVCIALAKTMLRSRTIWIDSIANSETMSSSGKRARYFADNWLTQWHHLARPEGPEYWGAVL